MKFFKLIAKLLAAFLGIFGLTFTVYWFNLDMKLVRKLYDWLQTHYDELKKDRKL